MFRVKFNRCSESVSENHETRSNVETESVCLVLHFIHRPVVLLVTDLSKV